MITLTISSPAKTAVYEKTESVSLPASRGRMQILPGHAESFVSLREGEVVIRQVDNPESVVVKISGGECHIKDDKVFVIL